MWRWGVIVIVVAGLAALGWSLVGQNDANIGASALLLPIAGDTDGFRRADVPYDWDFPRDHGAHPDFQTEWWYYTGNLSTPEGRRFGYQFTLFRRALRPETPASDASEWRSNQLYMAHFTLSDIEGQQFYHAERYSRGGADLAGAQGEPFYQIWLDDWRVTASAAAPDVWNMAANAESSAGTYSVDLALTALKPPALQGEAGLSQKSGEAGNASYYYSLSRIATQGTITVNGATFNVEGYSWMDQEFSTSALGSTALGWDWFGLHFDDGRDLMIGQIRLADGGREPAFGGLLIEADGSTRYLNADQFTITATDTWLSPHTGATYPSGWQIALDMGDGETIAFSATPLLRDQELHSGAIAYWEGAVQLAGDISGYGYAELTGYTAAMTGRF
jgi:predicted secreted hydrolase